MPLTELEERFARRYVEGIARKLAKGGDLTPEEYEKEVETIKKIALEPGAEVFQIAKTWKRRLLERIIGLPIERLKKMKDEELGRKIKELI